MPSTATSTALTTPPMGSVRSRATSAAAKGIA
jgi:hypothetical protein